MSTFLHVYHVGNGHLEQRGECI